jgi:hypothetical protein
MSTLLQERANLAVFDPQVSFRFSCCVWRRRLTRWGWQVTVEQMGIELREHGVPAEDIASLINYTPNPYEACVGSHAIVVRAGGGVGCDCYDCAHGDPGMHGMGHVCRT